MRLLRNGGTLNSVQAAVEEEGALESELFRPLNVSPVLVEGCLPHFVGRFFLEEKGPPNGRRTRGKMKSQPDSRVGTGDTALESLQRADFANIYGALDESIFWGDVGSKTRTVTETVTHPSTLHHTQPHSGQRTVLRCPQTGPGFCFV